MVAGAGAGALAVRALHRLIPDTPVEPLAAAGVLVLQLLAVLLPIMVGIALGVAPWPTRAVVLVGAAVALLSPLRRRVVLFGVFYGALLIVIGFKTGPGPDTCAGIVADGGARLLLARYGDDEDLRSAEPYDVLPLPGSDEVLASFKRTDRLGGFFELVDLRTPDRHLRLPTPRAGLGGGTALWPERLERDPATGRIWAQMIGAAAHAMWELDIARSGQDSSIAVRRRLPIPWEPGNPGIDAARNRLVLTYVPNRHGDNPLVEAFDLPSLAPVQRTGRTGSGPEMADYIALDPDSGLYYVPVFVDSGRFNLVEIDGQTGAVLRRKETFHPTVGIAADHRAMRIYATNVTAGTLDVYDMATLERVQRVPAGVFPRDLVFDRDRGLLYVGGYADGAVWTFDVSRQRVEPLGHVQVGSLLRGVGLDESTGRVFAASACGVFEVPTAATRGEAP